MVNCNFTDNRDISLGGGGVIYFKDTGTVSNCNFVNNSAKNGGGAVNFASTGNVTNCNFTGNTGEGDGGAVYFSGNGVVTNCNFTDNNAGYGGAIFFYIRVLCQIVIFPTTLLYMVVQFTSIEMVMLQIVISLATN